MFVRKYSAFVQAVLDEVTKINQCSYKVGGPFQRWTGSKLQLQLSCIACSPYSNLANQMLLSCIFQNGDFWKITNISGLVGINVSHHDEEYF